MKTLALIALIFTTAAHAQTRMSGAELRVVRFQREFEALLNGQFYGAEQFLPDRRSVWRAEDGTCVNGKWNEEKGSLCFLYDNGDGPYCWDITGSIEDMTITSTTGPDPLVLKLSAQDTTPIICTGPAFGV